MLMPRGLPVLDVHRTSFVPSSPTAHAPSMDTAASDIVEDMDTGELTPRIPLPSALPPLSPLPPLPSVSSSRTLSRQTSVSFALLEPPVIAQGLRGKNTGNGPKIDAQSSGCGTIIMPAAGSATKGKNPDLPTIPLAGIESAPTGTKEKAAEFSARTERNVAAVDAKTSATIGRLDKVDLDVTRNLAAVNARIATLEAIQMEGGDGQPLADQSHIYATFRVIQQDQQRLYDEQVRINAIVLSQSQATQSLLEAVRDLCAHLPHASAPSPSRSALPPRTGSASTVPTKRPRLDDDADHTPSSSAEIEPAPSLIAHPSPLFSTQAPSTASQGQFTAPTTPLAPPAAPVALPMTFVIPPAPPMVPAAPFAIPPAPPTVLPAQFIVPPAPSADQLAPILVPPPQYVNHTTQFVVPPAAPSINHPTPFVVSPAPLGIPQTPFVIPPAAAGAHQAFPGPPTAFVAPPTAFVAPPAAPHVQNLVGPGPNVAHEVWVAFGPCQWSYLTIQEFKRITGKLPIGPEDRRRFRPGSRGCRRIRDQYYGAGHLGVNFDALADATRFVEVWNQYKQQGFESITAYLMPEGVM
ncbi:hypothetical protein OF83DRAFT_132207 [Amylostereum chailletii]|nr:hypothetical protein OF83DRAFT_132207 [Amylostereum chailletii]